MDYIACMKILQCFGHLINDESNVNIFENVLRNDIVEIGFHELKDQINVLIIVCTQCIIEFYYVRMLSLF